jgi:poly [ADP-ribose] polymerase
MSKKGYIIDEHCNNQGGTLVDKNNMVYSCILNQTDIASNANKFYIMQLIKDGSSSSPKYVHFIRYGRIGEVGRISHKMLASEGIAINSFEKQFRTKTGNKWLNYNDDNNEFVYKKGKYFLSEISYEDELKDVSDDIDSERASIPDSDLDERVQDFIKMVSDVNMMTNTLIQLDIDTEKLPLGKIKQSQLDKAKNILTEIQKKVDELDKIKTNKSKVVQYELLEREVTSLSSEYYTLVPYACARKRPPVIDSKKMTDKYKGTLDDLENIAIGVQIINNVKADENPIDAIYKDINTTIKPLGKRNKMWKEISDYVANTHGPTHGYQLEIIDILEIEQIGKKAQFEKYCKNEGIGNNTLLFHGTPQSCVLSIFKRDFYLDPTKLGDTNVQIAGKMFGYGIYFADTLKSFNYTRAYQTNDIGCMLLGEVALGNVAEKKNADYYINKASLKKVGCHSTKGLGRWAPSNSKTVKGVSIPNGPIKEVNKSASLRYNEFIVYDVNQVLVKYLIIVKNNGNYSGF